MWLVGGVISGSAVGLIASAVIVGRGARPLVAGVLGGVLGSLITWLIERDDQYPGATFTPGLMGGLVGALVAIIVWRFVRRSVSPDGTGAWEPEASVRRDGDRETRHE